jgi:hypothetical protein
VGVLSLTFISAVIAAGAVAMVGLAPRELADPALALTCLVVMLAVSHLKLRMPLGMGQSTMSMAYVVDFTALVTLGVDVAMLIAAAGVLVQCTLNVRRPQPWYRTAFSVAAIVLSVQAAGAVWSALGGSTVDSALASVVPLALGSVAYFLVNTGLVTAAVSLANGVPAVTFWKRNFAETLPSYLVAAGVASLLGVVGDPYLLVAVALAPMGLTHFAYRLRFRHLASQLA